MNPAYLGYFAGAFGMQLVAGYIVGGLIGPKKRRRSAFLGALLASFVVGYLGMGPTPNQNYVPLIAWFFSAAFFWWRIGRTPAKLVSKPDTPPITR